MSKQFFSFSETSVGSIPAVSLMYDDGKHSHSIKVAVKEGNNLFSYVIDGRETIYYDPSVSLSSFAVGNAILFPFPNRIQDAIWTWKGEKRLQKKSGIPIQLHSLVYDETTFEYETPVVTEDSVTLKTYLKVDENHPIYAGYPFCFTLFIDYILNKNGLKIGYRIQNQSDKAMPYGLGFHPYFTKLSGEKGTVITVPCKYYYEVRTDVEEAFFNKTANGLGMVPNVMPTGTLVEAAGTKSDILSPTAIGDLDLDTVYTDLKTNPAAVIDYTDIGLKLFINGSEEFKHYIVYSPQGKPFFCIEPQTCSTDAINLFAAGLDHVNLLVCPKNSVNEGWVSYTYQV